MSHWGQPPRPGWVLTNRDKHYYHTSGIYRWVPPGDPAAEPVRIGEEGHEGISAIAALSAPLMFTTPANDIQPIPLVPKMVYKKWGFEKWLCNNDEFCGKLLHFNKGAQFSCHFHREKREVFWVLGGSIELTTINTKDASRTMRVLGPGDVIEIPRLCPHQITAREESEIVEFSTHHEDADSYRVYPGDSQTPTS